MNKENARQILEEWLKIQFKSGSSKLPIKDAVVMATQKGNTLSEHTFKSLIKTAYDLEDKTT